MCPEGQVSKTPPGLLTFRHGSFKKPIKHRMPVYGFVMLGCYSAGPGRSRSAGSRHGAREARPPCYPDRNEEPAELAERCHAKMQQMMDELVALRDGKSA